MAKLETWNNLATYFVHEVKHNEVNHGVHPDFRLEKLLESLAQQLPNRVYAGDNGNLGRIVFYSDESDGFDHAAYMDVLYPASTTSFDWTKVRSETMIVGRNPDSFEEQITRWKQRYGLGHDLVLKPDHVYTHTQDGDTVFVHTVGNGDKMINSSYFISHLMDTPKYVGFGRGKPRNEVDLMEINAVPEEVTRYANVFKTITS